MNWKRLAPALAAACSVTALAGAAFADPPGRVGRISDVEGWASFRPVDEDFWAPAQRNTPVTTGEGFWTGDGARLELQVAGLEARVDRQTSLDVLDLDYGVTRLSLAQGSIDLHIWRAPRGGVRIETAEGEVRIDQPGVYRIDALPAAGDDGDYGPVEVTVFEGQAFAPSDGGPVEVDAGQSLTYLPGYDVDVEDAQETGVDQWARARDAQWARARDAREAEIRRRDDLWEAFTGAADLDEYGDWADQPGYGRVWFPREAGPGWAPYRFGHWSFVRPWGWTWVDDQPWGFAPFHYGRWARFGDRWGWIAGEREAEPVYAPALVAFIGGGGWGVSIGVGGDAMGWVPLAPGEAYVPAYHVSGDYVRRVNAPHVSQTVINNIVVNNTVVINRTEVVYRNAPAATVVPTAAFSRGASVQKAAVAVPPAALARAPRAAALEQVAPTREARAGLPTGPGASSGAPAGGPAAFANAPQPPAKVMTLRAAVAAQPAGATRPQIALRPAAAASSQGGKPLQPHEGGQGGGTGPQPRGPERQGWSVPRMNTPGPNGPAPNGQGGNGARPNTPGSNGPAPYGQGWNGARPNTPGPNGPAPNGQGWNGARPNTPGPNGPAPNGQDWNGARPNTPGPNGPAPNGQDWHGARPNTPGPNGPAPNGQGWNGARPNTPGPNGPAPNGQGWNGARPNNPGSNGPAPNGQGWNGARPNNPGPNGPAPNSQGWNGARPNTPGPNGPAPNGQGWNGARPNNPGPNGPAPNSSGAPQQPTFRPQTPPPPAPPAPPRRDQAQPRPAPHAAPPASDKPDKKDKKDDKTKS